MLFYRPESYILPQSPGQTSPHRSSSTNQMYYSVKADQNPTLGAAGDPSKAPTKLADILK